MGTCRALLHNGRPVCTVGCYEQSDTESYMAAGVTDPAWQGRGLARYLIVGLANELTAERAVRFACFPALCGFLCTAWIFTNRQNSTLYYRLEYYMIEQFYDLRPEVLALDRKALDLCRAQFAHVEEIRDYNQLKMLRAFTDCGVEARHFWGSSGYGVWDDSRDKLEEVFARCMGAEAALVRPQFMSGTHTLTVALFGLLRTGDTLLAATGRPYDTLEGVIGIGDAGKGCGTLREFGVNYDECPLLPDFTPDL